MSPFYPEEAKRLDLIGHLEELRRRILICLLVCTVASIIVFMQGDRIIVFVKKPILGLANELIFTGPAEAFTACLKVALLSGFIVSFPVILYHIGAFLSPALDGKTVKRIVLWLVFALVLFLGGITFSYFCAIPAALNFLIGFGKDIAVPMITLGKYISFFGALILCGGVIFEIPIVIGFFCDVGLADVRTLRAKRHYAILAIMIFAAIITPTQDVFNMLLFAVPMILLYEAGIVIAVLIERRKNK